MFDKVLAQLAIDWFPHYLRHVKGRKWNNVPFELLPWQADIIGPLFGTLKEDGSRQYKTVYVEIPKKMGKSELAAGVALQLLFADGEPGAEIYGAAGDREQASIVFDFAAEMVRRNKKLKSRCKILETTKRIMHKNGSFYRVLSAEAFSKHGYNPHGIIFDELHTQPNRKLWDVLTEGASDARTQPVIFAITTAGYDRHSICFEMHRYAEQVRDRIIIDPTFMPVIYGAANEDDWLDEEVWKKVNPSLGVTIDIEKLREAAKLARQIPAKENNFRRLRLNQWVKQHVRYIPMEKWRRCGEPFNPKILEGRSCWAGLDLASIIDLASLVLMFPVDDLIYVLPFFWIPEETADQRFYQDKVPYPEWIKQGYIKATRGNSIDYDTIELDIGRLADTYHIEQIAFDRWNATQITQHLAGEGLDVVQFGQGWKSMNAPTKELLRIILNEVLRHGGNPVLDWNADNLEAAQDAAGNFKPDKKKSTEKIDGMVALIMGLDLVTRQESEGDLEIFTA